MSDIQIGTSEIGGCVGSRAAQSDNWQDAIEECRQYSLARHVKKAWLRYFSGNQLGDVLVTFVKGEVVDED
jgi:hypothetical protein